MRTQIKPFKTQQQKQWGLWLSILLAIVISLLILLISRPSAYTPVSHMAGASPTVPPRSFSREGSSGIPLNQGPFYPAYELYASRKIIADFQETAQELQNEAWNLEYDTRGLWDRWTQYIKTRGNFYNWIYTENKAAAMRRGWEERRQAEIFSLYGHVHNLRQSIRKTHGKIHVVETLWEELRERIDDAVDRDATGMELQDEFEEMKKELSLLTEELDEEDARMPDLQEEYDALRPLVLGHLNQVSLTTVYLQPPWHSHYFLSGNPRPEFNYKFENRYQNYWRQSRSMFSGGVKIQPARKPKP